MRIFLNEESIWLADGTTAFEARDKFKKDADVVVLNGFALAGDMELKENDRLVLIKRGEIPGEGELEALMAARHTPGVLKKAKNAKVGIAGLGGLGSNIAVALARVGVGNLVLVDYDVVEPSNLNRQHYFIKHIGMLKTEAIKEVLLDVNPYIKVDTKNVFLDESNIKQCFEGVDIVVEAFDNPKSKACLVNAILCEYPEKPVVAASGLAGYYSNNSIITKRSVGSLYIVGDEVSEAAPGCGLMAPRVSIAAGHQANMVLRLILGEKEV